MGCLAYKAIGEEIIYCKRRGNTAGVIFATNQKCVNAPLWQGGECPPHSNKGGQS